MNSELKTWSDTVAEEPMPVVVGSIIARPTLRDSSHELLDGLDVDELDTIPAELLEFFQ
jgi:hypothetical protein